jgi:hypothetical protein
MIRQHTHNRTLIVFCRQSQNLKSLSFVLITCGIWMLLKLQVSWDARPLIWVIHVICVWPLLCQAFPFTCSWCSHGPF